ncbi:MAG: DUF1049 domain-containing protein [Candidatus Nitronauta litoralis]|uniref:DUF1049 domain-containing protein n=1 Tax=Candidatus Nitronauta litoralis TaxID=2705533 RepID=A0A7T0BW82_9BACT|nr:MAG: DUF1049 domain-containing protein [Candidatus Nitronauta litoralis]
MAVYFAFLNPTEVEIHLTRNLMFEIPMVVFLMGSLLLGVLISAVFQSLLEIQASWSHFRENQKIKKQESRFNKWDKWYRKAESAIASGRLAKGLALYEKILSDNPHHSAALFQLGNHKRAQGEFETAIEYHQKALVADPEDFQALYSLAEDFAAAGDIEQEIETLNRCLELDSNSLPTLKKLRDAYLSTHNLDGAQNIQKSILGLVQDSDKLDDERALLLRIIYSIGMERIKEEKYDSAVAEFRRAIKEDESSAPAHVSLGDIYLKLENSRQALKAWKSGFEKTGAPVCLLRMQEWHDSQGKKEEGDKLLQNAIEKSEGKRQELLSLIYSQRLLAQGKSQDAADVLEKIEDGTILTRLSTIKALQDSGANDKADALIQSTFDQVEHAVRVYYCSACGHEFDTWFGLCPHCNSWATLTCGSSKLRAHQTSAA